MATFKKFEEIHAWQKARETTLLIYQVTAQGPCSKDFGLRDQLRKASVSIMANIAEGFGRRSNKEFANFLNIAHGSVAEVQSQLYIALDLKYIEFNVFDHLYSLLDQNSRMIMSLSQHLRATS